MKRNDVRADKLLSSLGLTSRRNVDNFLKKNKVFAGDKRIEHAGDRILPKDKIMINGKSAQKPQLVYYMLNKPIGYISTARDEFGRKNVLSLVKSKQRIFPVGRLDKDTHGLLLLTNDGDLTNKLIHPKFHIGKTYELLVSGRVKRDQIMKLENGVDLEDGTTSPAKVRILKRFDGKTHLELTIYEGKKRQIRRMCEALNIQLVDLKRISFGKLHLKDLKTGEFRHLSNKEIKLLKENH